MVEVNKDIDVISNALEWPQVRSSGSRESVLGLDGERVHQRIGCCSLLRIYFCPVNVAALAGGSYCCFIGEWRHAWPVTGGAGLINEQHTFQSQLMRVANTDFANRLLLTPDSWVTQSNHSGTLSHIIPGTSVINAVVFAHGPVTFSDCFLSAHVTSNEVSTTTHFTHLAVKKGMLLKSLFFPTFFCFMLSSS